MSTPHFFQYLCNSAPTTISDRRRSGEPRRLDYIARGKRESNIRVELPAFVESVYHIPPRILDLLEIACYVYCADRYSFRGSREGLEYHGWGRNMELTIKVRDYEFWRSPDVAQELGEVMAYMTGDESWSFSFAPGHITPPTSLFDVSGFQPEFCKGTEVALFSGGIDSLAGTVERLQSQDSKICLVSHTSGQPSSKRTQLKLFEALKDAYPGKLHRYVFKCNLRGLRAREESQRSRMFLYASIAFSISRVLGLDRFLVFENGVTSMNFSRREDLINARASRTTHPRVLHGLSHLFSRVSSSPFLIETPYVLKTKADIVGKLRTLGMGHLIPSSVSCSRTFKTRENTTHCGLCYQCIDRRFAMFACGMEEQDYSQLYSEDFLKNIPDEESKTTIIDFVRQGMAFKKASIDSFSYEHLAELAEIVEYLPGFGDPEDAAVAIWGLCNRHGKQLVDAIQRMRYAHDKPTKELPEHSLLKIIGTREHLREPSERFALRIAATLRRALPLAYQASSPPDEKDLNDKIEAILNAEKPRFIREFPAIPFALARSFPDHADGAALLVEAKYIRQKTTPSKVSEGIAADITKYSNATRVLFVIYDPGRSIADDDRFVTDIQSHRNCSACVIR